MNKAAIAGIIVAAVVGVGITTYFESKHDAAMDAAYATYTTCVQAQYGMSPTDYYQQYGKAADCK